MKFGMVLAAFALLVGCGGPTAEIEGGLEETGRLGVGVRSTMIAQVHGAPFDTDDVPVRMVSADEDVLGVSIIDRCHESLLLEFVGRAPGVATVFMTSEGQTLWSKAFEVTADMGVRWTTRADFGPGVEVDPAAELVVLETGDATLEVQMLLDGVALGEADDIWFGTPDDMGIIEGARIDDNGFRHPRVHVSASSPGVRRLQVLAGEFLVAEKAIEFVSEDQITFLSIQANADTSETHLWLRAEDEQGRRVYGLEEAQWQIGAGETHRGDRALIYETSSNEPKQLRVQIGDRVAERTVRTSSTQIPEVWDSGHPVEDFGWDGDIDFGPICCAQSSGTGLSLLAALGLFALGARRRRRRP